MNQLRELIELLDIIEQMETGDADELGGMAASPETSTTTKAADTSNVSSDVAIVNVGG